MLYRVHLVTSSWTVFEPASLVVIGTDCTSLININEHLILNCSVHVYGNIYLFCDSMWSFWVEANLWKFVLNICLYRYCHWRPSYQEVRVGTGLTGLAPPHFYACSTPGHWFPTSSVVVFLCSKFIEFRWEVITIFIDIGGIDDL
jgi:hypothetical protein